MLEKASMPPTMRPATIALTDSVAGWLDSLLHQASREIFP